MKNQNPFLLYAILALLICLVVTFIGVTSETSTQKPQAEAPRQALAVPVPPALGKTAKGRQFSREAKEALRRAMLQPVSGDPKE